MRQLPGILLIVPMIVLVGVCTAAQGSKGPDAKTVEHGQKIYADQKCTMCHSIGGKGGKVSALDDVGSRLTEEEVRQWLISPRVMTEKKKSTKKPLMPEYTKLSKEDLNALIAYMMSLKKK